jgi:hypothetical protein
MMCGFATFYGKHRIIATNGGNIIFAKQMHHIAIGDASLRYTRLRLDLFAIVCYNVIRKVVV